MSRRQFYREISFTLLYLVLSIACQFFAFSTGSKVAIGCSLIGSLVVMSSIFRIIANYRELDPGASEGLKKEEKDDDG